MPPAHRRLRRVSAIFASAAIVASIGSVGASGPPMIRTSASETLRTLTVPIRQSPITIHFDPGKTYPHATISYAQQDVQIADLLLLQSEVLPVVARVTGCTVQLTAPGKQLLADTGVTTIPLKC